MKIKYKHQRKIGLVHKNLKRCSTTLPTKAKKYQLRKKSANKASYHRKSSQDKMRYYVQ